MRTISQMHVWAAACIFALALTAPSGVDAARVLLTDDMDQASVVDSPDREEGQGQGGPPRKKRKICVLKAVARTKDLTRERLRRVKAYVEGQEGVTRTEFNAFPPIIRVRFDPPFNCKAMQSLLERAGLTTVQVEGEFTETEDLAGSSSRSSR